MQSGRPDVEEEDVVVGGVVGGRLKSPDAAAPAVLAVARRGGACATGRPLRGGFAGSVSTGVWVAFRRSMDTLSVLSPISSRKKCVDCYSTR